MHKILFVILSMLVVLSKADFLSNTAHRKISPGIFQIDTLFMGNQELKTDYAPRGLVFEVIELREEVRKLKDRVTDLELSLAKYKFKYPEYENKFKSRK